MEFVFVCPRHSAAFKTDAFRIVEHRGIRTDPDGRRSLDAKVRVDIECPFCGQFHVYAADTLACPFTDPRSSPVAGK